MRAQIFQTGALLEVLHSAVGLVGGGRLIRTSSFLQVQSPVMVTAQQVGNRIYMTWVILALFPPAQTSLGFPLLLTAWTITEIIRWLGSYQTPLEFVLSFRACLIKINLS